MERRDKIIEKYITPSSVGVEIGVWKGIFTKHLLESVSLSKLYAIDPWITQKEYSKRWYGGGHTNFKNINMNGVFENVKKKLKKYSNVLLIRDFSSNIKKYIKENELDWAYIDGNHSYEFVLEDLENCKILVRDGGVILCDDYIWNDKYADGGPQRAIKEFCEKYTLPLKIMGNQAIIVNTPPQNS